MCPAKASRLGSGPRLGVRAGASTPVTTEPLTARMGLGRAEREGSCGGRGWGDSSAVPTSRARRRNSEEPELLSGRNWSPRAPRGQMARPVVASCRVVTCCVASPTRGHGGPVLALGLCGPPGSAHLLLPPSLLQTQAAFPPDPPVPWLTAFPPAPAPGGRLDGAPP